MRIPDWFRSQLNVESDGRLRIRFSPYRGLWQIEAKRFRSKLSDQGVFVAEEVLAKTA